MNEIEFDKALSDFLDNDVCETTNQAMFDLVRGAFTAGWKAAMGSDLKQVMDIEKR